MKRSFLLLLCLSLLSPPYLRADDGDGDGHPHGDSIQAPLDECHHDGGGNNDNTPWFIPSWGKNGRTNISLNLSKNLGIFRVTATTPLTEAPAWVTLTAASAILIITFLPLWIQEYRLLAWLGFHLKPEDQLEQEAKALMQATRTVYAGPLRCVQDYAFKGAEIPSAHMRRTIMKWRKNHTTTISPWKEFCLRLNWLSKYRNLAEYPYSHFENRLSTTINWLERYNRAIKNQELKTELDDLLEPLNELLDEVRSSYEFAQERNYMRLIEEIKNKDGQLLTFNANVAT